MLHGRKIALEQSEQLPLGAALQDLGQEHPAGFEDLAGELGRGFGPPARIRVRQNYVHGQFGTPKSRRSTRSG